MTELLYVSDTFGYDLAQMVITLFVVMDPIGTIPIIMGLTQKLEPKEKKSLMKNAIITVAILLFVFALVGNHLLSLFNVEIASFMIAGGILLFIVSIEFLTHGEWRMGGGNLKHESGIVPLAFPLLSGPGALTVVMISYQTVGLLTTITAISIVVAVSYFVLALTNPIYKLLGKRGSIIVTRVFAIFIAAFGIQFILNGIHEVFL